MEHDYQVNVKWKEVRKGIMSSPSLSDIEIATPPQFPKGHEGIWSPEHLYVASAAVCLMTTFLAIAENSNLEFISYDSKAIGKLEMVDKKLLITKIHIEPLIKIKNKEDIDKCEKIIFKSEASCLISNSMKTEVTITPRIEI